MLFYITLMIFILPTNSVKKKLPLIDCRSNSFDVILHIPSIDSNQKIRLKWIVSNFLPLSENDVMKTRFAVLSFNDTRESLVELIGFHSYETSNALFQKIDAIEDFRVNPETSFDKMYTFLIDYFDSNSNSNKKPTKVIVTFTKQIERNANFYNDDNVIFFFIYPTNKYIPQFNTGIWEKNMKVPWFLNIEDVKVNSNLLSVRLCGQCIPGWFSVQVKSDLLSCYKFEVVSSAVSHEEALNQCEQLNATLVSLETKVEHMRLKERLSRVLVAYSQESDVSSFLFPLSSCEQIMKARNNENHITPYRLKSDSTSNQRYCLAWEITLVRERNSTELKFEESWIQISRTSKMSKFILCELEVSMDKNDMPAQFKAKWMPVINPLELLDVRNPKFGFFSCSETATNELTYQIPYSVVCDFETNCPSGRDEEICEENNKSHCKDGFSCYHSNRVTCSKVDKLCDGVPDCQDGGDETNCNGCTETTCVDGTCLPSSWFKGTGLSTSHFFLTKTRTCNISELLEEEFTNCSNTDCFSVIDATKGLRVCSRGYDVINKTSRHLVKWSSRCIYFRHRFTGETLGCSDSFHLEDCEDFICSKGFFKCPESYCIPLYLVRDEKQDCPRGEDEDHFLETSVAESIEIIQCRRNPFKNTFINKVHVCDGQAQCPGGDDEKSCYKSCPSGFTCRRGVTAVTDVGGVNYTELFETLDLDLKVLRMSGINFSLVLLPHYVIFRHMLELHLSNCSLTTTLLTNVLLSMGSSLHTLYSLDLSQNSINLSNVSVMLRLFNNLRYLNLSFTDTEHVHIYDSMWPNLISLDVSSTKLISLKISGFRFVTFNYINVSSTNIVSLAFFDDEVSIKTLDIRHTKVKFDYNTSVILRNFRILEVIWADDFKMSCEKMRGRGIPEHTCHTPIDFLASCSDLLGDMLIRVSLWVIGLVGLVGNITVVAFRVIAERRKLKQADRLFVTSLSISDFIMILYLMIVACADVYYGEDYVLYDTEWKESSSCTVSGFLAILSYETSAMFVLLITVDRYLVFRDTFRPIHMSFTTSMAAVAGVWAFGVILALIPALNPNWRFYSSNGMCLGLPVGVSLEMGWKYSSVVFIGINSILVFLITVGQILIYKSISLPSNSIINSSHRRKREIIVAKNLSLIAISSILCWFPVCIVCLMSASGHEFSPNTIWWLAVLVLPINAALNPIFYTLPFIYQRWVVLKKKAR